MLGSSVAIPCVAVSGCWVFSVRSKISGHLLPWPMATWMTRKVRQKTKIAIFRDIFWWFRVTILCRGNVEGASFCLFFRKTVYHWGFLPSKPTKGVIYESFLKFDFDGFSVLFPFIVWQILLQDFQLPFLNKTEIPSFLVGSLPNVQSKKTKLQVVRSQKLAAGKMKRRMRTTRRLVECWLFTGKGEMEKKTHRIGVSVDSSTLKIAGSFWWHLMA